MRLLKYVDGKISLTKDLNHNIPPYAILSHTWGPDEKEVTYRDLIAGAGEDKAGYEKIRFCAKQAARDNLQHFWIDACCIDKANNTELHEAINSMFRWYHNAARCYVYLVDVSVTQSTPPSRHPWDSPPRKKQRRESIASATSCSMGPPNLLWEPAFRASRWFTRGWTLQELLAPTSVEFFSKDSQRLGDKTSLEKQIHEITSIPISALRGTELSKFHVNERFEWAEGRQTTREEDAVYCLLGIFGVFMSLRYGEGKDKEAVRLRKKLEKRDEPLNHREGMLSALLRSFRSPSSPYVRLTSLQPEIPLLPFATIPFRRDPHFVDRGDILNEVDRRCSKPAGRAALVGLGGIGKSQLAIEFAHRIDERATRGWLFWIHAGTRARVDEGFQAIADAVKLPEQGQPKADIPQLVYSWLLHEQNGRWIMIIDSADDLDVFYGASVRSDGKNLASFLPQSQNGSILVTTRNKDLARRLTGNDGVIEVGAMAEAEALSLLQKKIGPTTDSGAATELVRTLEYVPLAIHQAAAYIQSRAPRSSVEKYLADFQESESKRTKLLEHDGGDLRRDGSASNAALATWQLSFEYIRSKRRSAADLLSLMSFFDRQGIPESLLKPTEPTADPNKNDESDSDNGSCSGEVDGEFEDDIATLKDFCLLSMNENGTEFEMHGLVQLSTRKWIKAKGFAEDFKKQYLTRLEISFPRGDYENWEACQKLFPHVEAAIKHRPKDGPNKEDLEKVWATLLFNGYARLQGRYDVAERMAHKTKSSRIRLLGVKDPSTLSSISLFALVLLDKGQWNKAEELFVEVMEARKRKLGAHHPSTLSSMANLALTYRNQGRWDKAEELFVEVMEVSKRKLGADHPDTLTSMNNLSSTWKCQGRHVDALKLMESCVEARRRVLGPRHPYTLTSSATLDQWRASLHHPSQLIAEE